MPLLKRRTSREAEIPTASMADIAFLLLIFFLVTTTIDVDSGIYMELPPKLDENNPPPQIAERNLLNVLVNAQGQAVVDGRWANSLSDIRTEVKRHVTNNGRNPEYADAPDKAIVSFKTERGARYEIYVNVLDEIKLAYQEVRDEYARSLGRANYTTYQESLGEGDEDEVARAYPIKISLAEPDAGGGTAAAVAAPAN